MPQVINTNIASLNSQRNLNVSQNSLNTALQRLSSGLRINSAKDDAAGLAISERMTAQIRGLNQAARNANDGISLAQTAEGALGEIGSNLQRIRELAVQSSNATNSADDRAALQKEVAQLISEIDRVSTQTSFNGTKLLDGSFANQAFQVGANQGQTINIAQIANAQTSELGNWTSVSSAGTASFDPTTLVNVDFSTESVSLDITVDGGTAQTITLDSNYTNGDALASAINGQLTGATAAFANGEITITSATTGASSTIKVDNFNADADGDSTNSLVTALPTVTSDDGTDGTSETGFDTLDISTVTGAENAILAMDGALNAVNSARADLGAIQNRFGSVVTNLNTTSENLAASRSRIQDTDFAAETAALTRAQILQQAGVAMLAQANALPNNVLSLLR